MEFDTIIKELKENVSSSNKSNDFIAYKSFQVRVLDGYFGTVINQNKETNEYEVFSYLKNKYDIVSPLNLKDSYPIYFPVDRLTPGIGQ